MEICIIFLSWSATVHKRSAGERERENVFSKLQRLFILWAVYGFSFKYVYIRIFLHLFVLDQADGTVLSIVLNFLVKFKF